MDLVEQGVATVEDIDKGLRLASGRKMGIFETGDMVGLDVRITSYNVCYTKLLRPGSRFDRSDHRDSVFAAAWYVSGVDDAGISHHIDGHRFFNTGRHRR